MKRKKTSARSMRLRKTSKPLGASKYAQKVKAGKQMYGPGCCANGPYGGKS